VDKKNVRIEKNEIKFVLSPEKIRLFRLSYCMKYKNNTNHYKKNINKKLLL
jgi:hypothetical protein